MGAIKLMQRDGEYILIDETDEDCIIEVTHKTFEGAQKQFNDWIDELAEAKDV
jgi:hypothetical protein